MHTANTGYMITQGPGGAPVAISMQAGVAPGTQGGQPNMGMIPVSGAGGYQPQLAQAVPPGAMTTGYYPPPQQAPMPPSYAQGQYMTQQNEQVL